MVTKGGTTQSKLDNKSTKAGTFRPSQHLNLHVVLIKPFLKHFLFVTRHIVLLKEATAIRNRFHERVYMVCNNA
ncbi:hypothetical protein QTP86_020023 [Hemibagrus guttatus]|nr:hypothetical protein QTP86_020023 [Hemibagrus guttatus]